MLLRGTMPGLDQCFLGFDLGLQGHDSSLRYRECCTSALPLPAQPKGAEDRCAQQSSKYASHSPSATRNRASTSSSVPIMGDIMITSGQSLATSVASLHSMSAMER